MDGSLVAWTIVGLWLGRIERVRMRRRFHGVAILDDDVRPFVVVRHVVTDARRTVSAQNISCIDTMQHVSALDWHTRKNNGLVSSAQLKKKTNEEPETSRNQWV